MATDLSTVQQAVDRKTVCDDSTALKSSQSYIDETAAAKQEAMKMHWGAAIANWCNITELTDPNADQGELSLPINDLLDTTWLDVQETTLIDRGYTVVRAGRLFTVKLSP